MKKKYTIEISVKYVKGRGYKKIEVLKILDVKNIGNKIIMEIQGEEQK